MNQYKCTLLDFRGMEIDSTILTAENKTAVRKEFNNLLICQGIRLKDRKIKIEENVKKFPNGFESWQETHFEIVSFIIQHLELHVHDDPFSTILQKYEEQGRGGLYLLAEKWTTEFEETYKDVVWGETKIESKEDWSWYDFIDEFCETKRRTSRS